MREDIQLNNTNNPTDRYQFPLVFFDEFVDKKGKLNILINNPNLILFWEQLGYRKVMDDLGNYILVNIQRNSIVKEVKEHTLRYERREYTSIKKRHDVWKCFLQTENVTKKLFESFHTIDMNRNTGDEKTGYLYYQNVILKITADEIELIEYENFQGYVWEKEIIKRDFIFSEEAECVFGEFLRIIADEEPSRIKSIVSIIGYLIHSFKDSSFSKSIILMDSEIDVEFDEANGGTGKSLIGTAIGHIVP